jgi:hypothetical protein
MRRRVQGHFSHRIGQKQIFNVGKDNRDGLLIQQRQHTGVENLMAVNTDPSERGRGRFSLQQ